MTAHEKSPKVLDTLEGLPKSINHNFTTVPNVSPNFDEMPNELKELNQWVAWKYEPSPGKKPGKVPYSPNGCRANVTNASTWGTYEQIEIEYLYGNYSGIGFVLNGNGIVGIDLDHCVIDGQPTPDAMEILEKSGSTYIEISPSGTGLRALGYGPQIIGTAGVENGVNTELYSSGRYLTLTGRTLKNEPLAQLREFAELAEKIRGKSALVSNSDGIDMPLPVMDDVEMAVLSSATMYLAGTGHGVSYHDWTNVGQALKAESRNGREPELRALFLAYSHACGGFVNEADVLKKWGQLKGTKTGRGAIFSKATELGWLNPAKGRVVTNNNRYKLLTGTDLRNLPPMVWRVRDVLPAVGLASIYGPSKAGKSFLCIDLACAIVEGMEWFGHRVEAAQVVYVALEGEAGFKQRAGAWETKNGRDLPAGFNMVMQPFNLTTAQDIADLAHVVPHGAVVFLDTLRRAAPTSDENASKDMGEILEGAKQLMVAINGLVIVVHHTGKNEAQGMRGHSSLLGALDASLSVVRNGDKRSWASDKVKEGLDGESTPFKLEVVTVGLDDNNDVITSCVVVSDNSPVTRTLGDLKYPVTVVLETLKKLIETQGKPPPEKVKNANGSLTDGSNVVPHGDLRTACYQAGITKKETSQTGKLKAFNRAVDVLLERNLVGLSDGFAWVK